MGIKAAFEQDDGFRKIFADVDMKVDKVNHRATIENTKYGTVGAAATSVEFGRKFLAVDEVIIDKPFLFYVRDTVESTILFAGKYFNPNEDPQN